MATFPLTTLIYDSSSTSNIRERNAEFQSAKVTVTGHYIFQVFFSLFLCLLLIFSSLPFQAVIHSYYTHLSSMMELNFFAFVTGNCFTTIENFG